MQVDLYVADGVFDSGLTTFLDAFRLASFLAPSVTSAPEPFAVRLTGSATSARTHLGLQVATSPYRPISAAGVLVVPALFVPDVNTLGLVRRQRAFLDASAAMRQAAEAGGVVATACSGAFFAGDAGLLDGRRATCAWWLAAPFRVAFPRVHLEEGRMLVCEEKVITAGGGLGHLNLALYLIRQHSPLLAQRVSQHLAVDTSPSQAPFFYGERMHHGDRLVLALEAYLRDHLSEAFRLVDVSRRLGVSPRSLQRRVQEILGRSPLQLVQDMRLEQAVFRVRKGQESIDEIAVAVGYQSGVTLRNLLRRKLGVGLRDLRRRAVEK